MKDNKKLILTGLIIVIILILVSLFVNYKINQEKQNENYTQINKNTFLYNGFTFLKGENMWTIETEKNELLFRYPPWEVDDISYNDKIEYALNNINKIYLTTDPTYSSKVVLGMVDVAKFFNPKLGFYNISAEAAFNKDGYSKDKKTCVDANQTTLIIQFLKSDETYISYIDNCITIYGKEDWDVVRASDLLMYKWLSIID